MKKGKLSYWTKRSGLFFPVFLLCAMLTAGCGGGGGGGGASSTTTTIDTTPPTLSMTYPGQDARVSDVDFASSSFYIQFRYADTASQLSPSSIAVSFQMDGGAAQNVSSYFSATSATTIKTNSTFTNFANSLFDVRSNDSTRTMTVNISVRDSAGNLGATSTHFIVYPVAPPG